MREKNKWTKITANILYFSGGKQTMSKEVTWFWFWNQRENNSKTPQVYAPTSDNSVVNFALIELKRQPGHYPARKVWTSSGSTEKKINHTIDLGETPLHYNHTVIQQWDKIYSCYRSRQTVTLISSQLFLFFCCCLFCFPK